MNQLFKVQGRNVILCPGLSLGEGKTFYLNSGDVLCTAVGDELYCLLGLEQAKSIRFIWSKELLAQPWLSKQLEATIAVLVTLGVISKIYTQAPKTKLPANFPGQWVSEFDSLLLYEYYWTLAQISSLTETEADVYRQEAEKYMVNTRKIEEREAEDALDYARNHG